MSEETPQEPEERAAPKKRTSKKAAPEQAAPEEAAPEEVAAEPVSPGEAAGGRTYDMPPPGSQREPTAPGTSNLAVYGWAAACHLLGLADLSISFFMIGILAPLVLWLARRETDPEVDFAGKEAVNFQLNLLFWQLVAGVLSFCLIGIPMIIGLAVAEIVLVVLATIETYNGRRYRYPWILRVLE